MSEPTESTDTTAEINFLRVQPNPTSGEFPLQIRVRFHEGQFDYAVSFQNQENTNGVPFLEAYGNTPARALEQFHNNLYWKGRNS